VPAAAVPQLHQLHSVARVVRVPLVTRFRGVDEREAMLFDGPSGWGEFAPFPDYPSIAAARWLAAAVEAAWGTWPVPVRDRVPVNAIVPAVGPEPAAQLVRDSGGCRTVKVKVAEPGQNLEQDLARVAAVAAALAESGPGGRLRVDANGGWSVPEAVAALPELVAAAGGAEAFDYVEQPCATLAEQAEVRRLVQVRVAVDEGLRKAAVPAHVAGLREAADVLVLKAAPLGGVRPALEVAAAYRLPVVVSSALDTSVGLAAGVALAAALPALDGACGLGSGRLLARDVVAAGARVLPVGGSLPVTRPAPDPGMLDELAVGPERDRWWRSRLDAAYEIMAAR
jgi:O-succinylbenzoate synthase